MGKNGMTAAEVVGWLRDMCFDYQHNSEEEKALMAAADAIESETVIEVDAGYARVVSIHPLLDARITGQSVEGGGA